MRQLCTLPAIRPRASFPVWMVKVVMTSPTFARTNLSASTIEMKWDVSISHPILVLFGEFKHDKHLN